MAFPDEIEIDVGTNQLQRHRALFSFSPPLAQPRLRSARRGTFARAAAAGGRRFGRNRGRGGGNRLLLAARAALVVLIVGILGQPVVERMAHLPTTTADEVDALDGLVDPLAIENAAAEFFNADAEQLGILALYLASSGFVLGKVRIFISFVRHIPETCVAVALGSLAFPRSAHRVTPQYSTRTADVAAGLFAHQVETLAPEARELGHLALRAAARTHVLVLQFAAFFRGLCFLFCHCQP